MMIDAAELFERVLETYAGVGKTGKPQAHEHTTLAAVAVSFEQPVGGRDVGAVIVAMATGTKCLPAVSRRADGAAVHDSHAEVLVRRTTVRWLMDELDALHAGRQSAVFERGREREGRARLRTGVAFHLVVSAAPCGDCKIVDGVEEGGEGEGEGEETRSKRQRTGAKVVWASSSPPGQTDVEKHSQRVGVVRRKPGKGSPTSSCSCSDKILRWNHLGFQGCLLRSLLEAPLYFSSVTAAVGISEAHVGAVEVAATSEASLRRGTWDREAPDDGRERPSIRCIAIPSRILDGHGLCATGARRVGAGYGVSWWSGPSSEWRCASRKTAATATGIVSEVPKACKDHREVLIGKLGYKASANCKAGATLPSQFVSRLSRSSMRARFFSLRRTIAGGDGDGDGDAEDGLALSHEAYKQRVCPCYLESWRQMRRQSSIFRNWIDKST